MEQLKEIYNLRDDKRVIKAIQEVSLDKSSQAGLKIENGLLFGTDEWFRAISEGKIEKHIVTGIISKIFMSGHNDYPEFEIKSNDGKTSVWTREGKDSAYEVGRRVELVYVEQRYKRPSDITGPISKCILQVKIAM